MAYDLTIAGYTFQNPPEEYRKLIRLGNSPQTAVNKEATDFYQSDSQNIQLQLEGTLALDPPLGEDTDDLDELERLQELAIEGGSVIVNFEPFFRGDGIIVDDPFSQSAGESSYQFTIAVNAEYTNFGAYPARDPPNTGNTFQFGDIDLGYDPDAVRQNYERQTEQVKRLQGVSRSVDTEGLIPKVNVSGKIDGYGQAQLWDKARQNVLAYLNAEFQNGWCLIDTLSIRNDPEAPDYLEGLFQYDLDVLIVKEPDAGIGDVSSYVDQEVKRTGTYAGDAGSGDSDFDGLDFTVDGGSGSLDGDYIEWNQTTLTLSDNDTNYVYADDDGADGYGTVKVNQSTFPADGLELYRVEVSGGQITKVVDVRSILLNDRDSDEGGSTQETITGDIYITIASGDYEMNPGVVADWESTRLLLQPNTTNYIWAEDPEADGTATVETNTTGYPGTTDFVKLYRAETDADSITNLIDDRPADISDSTTNTSGADLNLADDLRVRDQNLDFERLLRLADTLAVSEQDLLPALGLVTLAEDILSVADGNLDAKGVAELTDVMSVNDGGTGGAGTITRTIVADGTGWKAGNLNGLHPDLVPDTLTVGVGDTQYSPTLHTRLKADSGDPVDVSGSGVVPDGYNNISRTGQVFRGEDRWQFNGQVGATSSSSASYIDWGDIPEAEFGNTDYTIEIWYYADSSIRDVNTSGNAALFVKTHSDPVDGENTPWYLSRTGNTSRTVTGEMVQAEMFFRNGGDYDTTITGTTQDVWRHHTIRYDESSGTAELLLDGSLVATDSVPDYSWGQHPSSLIQGLHNSNSFPGTMANFKITKSYVPDSDLDYIETGNASGYTETFAGTQSWVTISFGSVSIPAGVDQVSFTADSYSNSVQQDSITVNMSDGTTEYDISSLSSGDEIRITITMDVTTNPWLTAQVSAPMEVTTGSGGDADQNPRTSWEILGAEYDTAGNEYEGGGVISRYGG